jgi:hypothetical protein
VPPAPQVEPPNWNAFAGTWQDAKGSRLTIDLLGRVSGKLVDAPGGQELKIGLGGQMGNPNTLQRGPWGESYLNANPAGGAEHCRLNFTLAPDEDHLVIVETPGGAAPRNYHLQRVGAGQVPPQGGGEGP